MISTGPGNLAIDVGGANLKFAHSSGVVRSVPFALWKDPEALTGRLRSEFGTLPPFRQLLCTMTGELCDCFRTKREGVFFVLESLREAVPETPILVWGNDARFHEPEWIRDEPIVAAASNWSALASVAAQLCDRRPGLLIDVGSTTTDLIPLLGGMAVPRGQTDRTRLQSGELVYLGVRRTPISALAGSLPFRGRATRLMAELFATTLDVFVMLGDLPEDPTDQDTADGRSTVLEFVRERLARMVGEDRDGFTFDDARALARSVGAIVEYRLREASEQALSALAGPPEIVVTAGSGEFLARRLANRLVGHPGRIISLGEVWGPEESSAACAVALLKLAEGNG